MTPEDEKIETCRVAMKAALEAIQDYCGTGEPEKAMPEKVKDPVKANAFRTALRTTVLTLCEYCGVDKITIGMTSELQNLAEIIDNPEMFADALDKMCKRAPAGVKNESKAAACREALRVTIVALCDYCNVDRPTVGALWMLQHFVSELGDATAFQDNLNRVCYMV